MTLADDLRAARALIDTEEKWAIGQFSVESRQAFCAIGAIRQAVSGGTSLGRMSGAKFTRYADARAFIEQQIQEEGHYLATFNDTHSHGEVLALFDRAINAAELASSRSNLSALDETSESLRAVSRSAGKSTSMTPCSHGDYPRYR